MPYHDPHGIIAACVVLEAIAVAAVIMRFLARRKRQVPWKPDDWLILVSLICATCLTIMEIYGCAVSSLGVPLMATVENPRAVTERLNTTKHIELSFLLVGILTLGLIKMSVVLLYRRIFIGSVFNIVTLVWTGVIVLWTVGFIMAGLLECGSHITALFASPGDYARFCGSAILAGRGMVASDVVTDIITLIMPLPMIFNLQMPLRRKVGIATIFAVGLFSVGAGIGKAYIYIDATIADNLERYDAIIWITSISVWNLVETQIAIAAACAPTLRPILVELWPSESLSRLIQTLKQRSTSTKLSGDVKNTGSPASRSTGGSRVHLSDPSDSSTLDRRGNDAFASTYVGNGKEYELQSGLDGGPNGIAMRRDLYVEQV